MNETTKSVFVAVIGRPNVGKSSLLNRLVGEKVAIVTDKPQTTRTRITGILTQQAVQYVFIDTPGFHNPRTRLGGRMNQTVKDAVSQGDAVAMLFEPKPGFTPEENEMIESLGSFDSVAVVNKTDIFAADDVEKKLEEIKALGKFSAVLATSAENGDGCTELLNILQGFAIDGPHFFPQDAYTDLPEKQLVAEIIREKLLRHLQQELPHGIAVEVERFNEREDKPLIEIDANIYCEKKSHKGMIIGKQGQMLKTISSEARRDCEEMLDTRVNLKCWVKVKEGWRDNEFLLNNLGFRKQ